MKALRAILDYEIARPLTRAARMAVILVALFLLLAHILIKEGIPISTWIAAGAACSLSLVFFTVGLILLPNRLRKLACIALFAIPLLCVSAQAIFLTNFPLRPPGQALQLLKGSIVPLIAGASLYLALLFVSVCYGWYGYLRRPAN